MRGIRQEWLEGKFRSVTIKHNPNDTYTASILSEIQEDKEEIEPICSIGIDLGVKVWITESSGKQIHQTDLSQVYLKLKKEEQQRDKKQKNSNNRKKAQIKMNRLHSKINNKKTDQIHKVTASYAGREIVHENLRTSELFNEKKKNLNKSIQDQNWSTFLGILKYKTTTTEIEKAYTSLECHQCHYTSKLNRKNQATFKCKECQSEYNADHNAAINILNRRNCGDSLSLGQLADIVSKKQSLACIYPDPEVGNLMPDNSVVTLR